MNNDPSAYIGLIFGPSPQVTGSFLTIDVNLEDEYATTLSVVDGLLVEDFISLTDLSKLPLTRSITYTKLYDVLLAHKAYSVAELAGALVGTDLECMTDYEISAYQSTAVTFIKSLIRGEESPPWIL